MSDFIVHLAIIAAALVWLVFLFNEPKGTIFCTLTLGAGYIGSSAGFLGTCLGLLAGATGAGLLLLLFWLLQQAPAAIERAKEMWLTTHGRNSLGTVGAYVSGGFWSALLVSRDFLASDARTAAVVFLGLPAFAFALGAVTCWLGALVRRVSLHVRGLPQDPKPEVASGPGVKTHG